MGKVSRAFFENVIARHLGEKRRDVVVGPANGVDVGVVRLPDGRALVSTTDPIYIVPQDGWVTADMAKPGNRLLVTKTAALEATAILSNTFPELVHRRLGEDIAMRASALFDSMSTVEDALAAASVGLRGDGVRAMHDATEGGVRNAVWEMAQASGLGVEVDLTKVIVDPAVAEVSKLFGMEPLDAISEGTLLIATEADAADEVLASLRKKGIAATDIGGFTKPGQPCTDRGRPFRPADRDPFWIAFSRAFAGEII